jgi:transcriptional antiterminator RfaH
MMASPTNGAQHAHWYAIWTKSRQEHAVFRQLHEKNIEAFLPTVARWSRWKDRQKRLAWPLFPGYCFARFSAYNSLPVLTCSGVARIVSCAGIPGPVSDQEISSLRLVVEAYDQYDPCPLIPDGATVEVVGGPLRGVVGRLLERDAKTASVVVAIELLGRGLRLELGAGDIRLY